MATPTAAPGFHLNQSFSSGMSPLLSSPTNDIETRLCSSGGYRDPLVRPPHPFSSVLMSQSCNALEARVLEQREQDATSLSSNITTIAASSSSSSSSFSPASSGSLPSTTTTIVDSSTSVINNDPTIATTTIANTNNSHKEMPFYGLPLEILQHIASFLPFHDLVRLYTCLPKIHRPIFQLLLDHSLALMMLTLEIRQLSDEQPATRDSFFVSLNNNPNGVGAARKLQTHWRVTDFDLDRMKVEFQLEEKLGLEMAERRRWEIEYQIQQQLQQQQQQKGREGEPLALAREQLEGSRRGQRQGEEDIENLIWRTRTGDKSSSSSTSSLTGAGSQQRYDSEVSDSNFFHCNGSSHTPTLGSATVSFKAQRNMPAPWISQHFDFAAKSSPASASSSVSYSTASSSSSASSSVTPPVVETPAVIRARERVAAYQQNRLLLRALAKMRSCEESSKLQFLPVTVKLETEELGQKKVEAELVDGTGDGVRRRTTGHGKVSVASVGHGAKLGRRHSWQALRPSTDLHHAAGSGIGASSPLNHRHHHHYSPLEPFLNFGTDLSSNGWTKALKRILRRSSWNENSSSRSRSHTTLAVSSTTSSSSSSSSSSFSSGCSNCDPRPYRPHHHHYNRQQQQQQQQSQRQSMDSLRAVDWSSVFHNVALSMQRSSSSSASHSTTTSSNITAEGCQCPHRKAVLITTSKQQDLAAAAKAATSPTLVPKRRSFSNMVAGYRRGKTHPSSDSTATSPSAVDKGKGKATTITGPTPSSSQEQKQEEQERRQKLFEFSYSVRHNYLHSHRLEGERVIRPMRFACSLDFFIQD